MNEASGLIRHSVVWRFEPRLRHIFTGSGKRNCAIEDLLRRPMASGGTPICRPVQARFIGPLGGASDAIGCKGGAFVLLEYSASIASLSHIRAMSIRMDWTLGFGARAAICRHSMACRLHSTGVIMATRQDVRSLAPIPNYTTTIAVFRWTLFAEQEKFPRA